MLDRIQKGNLKLKEIHRIDVIPLIVIIIALLAISMMSTSTMFGEIKLELPKAEADTIILDHNPLVISITKDESIYLNKNKTKISTLPRNTIEESNGNLDAKILIRADKELSYNKITNVISIINSVGFSDVSLIVDTSKSL